MDKILQDRLAAATRILQEIHTARLIFEEKYTHYHSIREDHYNAAISALTTILGKVLSPDFEEEQTTSLLKEINLLYGEKYE